MEVTVAVLYYNPSIYLMGAEKKNREISVSASSLRIRTEYFVFTDYETRNAHTSTSPSKSRIHKVLIKRGSTIDH
jgi:hypothetical protein